MSKTISFIFFLTRFSIANGVGVLSCPKLDIPALLPSWLEVQVYTKLLCLSVKINLIVKSIGDFFVVSLVSTYLYSTDSNGSIQHLASDLNLACMLILIYFENGEFPLGDQ